MNFNARVDVNCGQKDGRTENRTPISHLAEAGAKKMKITPNYPKSAAKGVFPRDSRTSSKQFLGKRAISVQAIEVLLYKLLLNCNDSH